jgi:mevalonate kinase
MTTSSAPGKIILFGEHAVVYGRPALAVPVTQVSATAKVIAASHPGIWIKAPDISLSSDLSLLDPDNPLVATIRLFFSLLTITTPPQLSVQITSTIPIASGMGSGAAVSVAIIRAMSLYFQIPLSDNRVSTLAYEIEKIHHGNPSGIDNTVITYSKPVYYVKGHQVEIFSVDSPLTFVIGDTGIPAPTRESVSDVHRLWELDMPGWNRVFDEIGNIVNQAKLKIENGDQKAIGDCMNNNHTLLQRLTVSSKELDNLVEAARRSGALGAKMSGGGRGGNMIALTENKNAPAVTEALMSAGAKRTIVTTVE